MNDLAQKDSPDSDSFAPNSLHLNASFLPDENFAHLKGEKYIVFYTGGQIFAVSSSKVSEVVQMLAVTPLPNVPEWLLGIADLRGGIISVVSLRKLLGAPDAPLTPKSKFIIFKSQKFPSTIALAVDKLGEIVGLSNEEIQPVKDEETSYLLGKAHYKSNALSLLDAENLLAYFTI